jgi:hypothetical protein
LGSCFGAEWEYGFRIGFYINESRRVDASELQEIEKDRWFESAGDGMGVSGLIFFEAE